MNFSERKDVRNPLLIPLPLLKFQRQVKLSILRLTITKPWVPFFVGSTKFLITLNVILTTSVIMDMSPLSYRMWGIRSFSTILWRLTISYLSLISSCKLSLALKKVLKKSSTYIFFFVEESILGDNHLCCWQEWLDCSPLSFVNSLSRNCETQI